MCDRQQSSLSCADSLAGEDPDLSSQEEEEEGVFVYIRDNYVDNLCPRSL